MPIVRMNPRQELREFYPVMLAPRSFQRTVSRGMGGQQLDQQINSIATTGASTTVGILTSLGTLSGPVGAAIAGVIAVASLIANMIGKGCGQTCIVASNDANKIEPVLQQNLQAYLSSPVRYKSLQTAALNNFDTVWNALKTACSDPSLAAAGQRCISDRQSGACKYHTSPGGWANGVYTAPGQNNSGPACWNWFIGYRDPIANDPTVVPDPTPAPISNIVGTVTGAASDVSTALSSLIPSGMNLSSLLIPGALLLGGLVLAFSGGSRR